MVTAATLDALFQDLTNDPDTAADLRELLEMPNVEEWIADAPQADLGLATALVAAQKQDAEGGLSADSKAGSGAEVALGAIVAGLGVYFQMQSLETTKSRRLRLSRQESD
jgi:hypothetical protein